MANKRVRRALKQLSRIRKRLRQVLVDAAGHHQRWTLRAKGLPILNVKSALWGQVRWPRSLRGNGKEVRDLNRNGHFNNVAYRFTVLETSKTETLDSLRDAKDEAEMDHDPNWEPS